MKKALFIGLTGLFISMASVADARSSFHIGIDLSPFFFSYMYSPPAFYYPPQPDTRYVPAPPREREVIRSYREGDCRVTETRIYDSDGFMIDRETRRNCRDGGRYYDEY